AADHDDGPGGRPGPFARRARHRGRHRFAATVRVGDCQRPVHALAHQCVPDAGALRHRRATDGPTGGVVLNLQLSSINHKSMRVTFSLGAAAAVLLAGCAVGPDFKPPPAPEVSGYTPMPFSTTSGNTNIAGEEPQRFVNGADIPGQWWTMFHSQPLTELIELSLSNNPNIKAAQAALGVARENVLAQKRSYYPSIAGSFSAARQKTSGEISPTPNSGALYFSLYTPQVSVSYVPDVFGLNRRTVESLKAQEEQARFALAATHITLSANVAAAAIQEASLRAQIEATRQLVGINSNMLQTLRKQFAAGYIGRVDVATQESQLAQVSATLPPLLKQLAQQRDLLAALSGRFPTQAPAAEFALSSLQLP